jgi:hypothetical protein
LGGGTPPFLLKLRGFNKCIFSYATKAKDYEFSLKAIPITLHLNIYKLYDLGFRRVSLVFRIILKSTKAIHREQPFHNVVTLWAGKWLYFYRS